MNQISIYSDVDSRYVVLDNDVLTKIEMPILDELSNNYPIMQVSGKELHTFRLCVENIINYFLRAREGTNDYSDGFYKKINTNFICRVSWNTEYINLYLKNENDVKLASLIILHEIIIMSQKTMGNIFISERNFLHNTRSDSILAYLRSHGRLKQSDLIIGILILYEKSENSPSIDENTLKRGLEKLIKFGLVHIDANRDECILTARGYLFQ